ncbi:hypothetical protein AV530_018007 [Patagioenas fasciata monilis]|uniref:Uncharacterized protein n=1 Tax=Patagioenas fasciata monilis TaxID=372326 RepID=A0A1V4KKI3_PATFA|nr:hypothetical protein AV530_018007 [Patagioenas fasciata monilis]
MFVMVFLYREQQGACRKDVYLLGGWCQEAPDQESVTCEERFSLITLLLFVLDSPDYTGTCLVFTTPCTSPPCYFGPDQFSPSNKLLQAELLLSMFVALGCAAGKTQA